MKLLISGLILIFSLFPSISKAQTCSGDNCNLPPAAYVIPAPSDIANSTAQMPLARWGIGLGWSFAADADGPMTGGGFNLQFLFGPKFGVDFYFRGHASADDEADNESRTQTMLGASLLYFWGSGASNRGINPYFRTGFAYKNTSYYNSYDSSLNDIYRTETATNFEIGGGLQWRFPILLFGNLVSSINIETVLFIPGREEAEDRSSIFNLRVFFMIHF
ncbi:hypothetical protein KKF34_08715 [Myxococcota bacterium]|nr:hypothetical protein [Myxococcota bacterium]MBU1380134.1 hypothetical protein [Myxococcota bacterium]MBU1496946.1 hypothetical protein [Myxococcota bacterium]